MLRKLLYCTSPEDGICIWAYLRVASTYLHIAILDRA
jgi:hypothetical protein